MTHRKPIEPDEITVEDASAPRRSLMALSRPEAPGDACPFSFRPDASFVAQLIAGAANMPQARALRRASPEDALASYRSANERGRAQASAIGKDTSLVA
jgi:hypothetical protein